MLRYEHHLSIKKIKCKLKLKLKSLLIFLEMKLYQSLISFYKRSNHLLSKSKSIVIIEYVSKSLQL